MSRPRGAAYLLYDGLLALGAAALLPWALVRCTWDPEFRRGLRDRLALGGPALARGGRRRLLLHGVSVGEVVAMRPLVRALLEEESGLELVLSSTTPSGRATARRLWPDLPVRAFPLDLRGACRRFLDQVRPDAVILMELEIWPNFLRVCGRRGIPVAIVNGRITERSMGGYLRVQRLLPQFDRIGLYGVQNELYAERFRRLQVPDERIVVTGNLKYDNLPESGVSGSPPEPWRHWFEGRVVLACGSTHEPEEREILEAVAARQELSDLVLVFVPRHPDRAGRLLRRLEEGPRPVFLRSRLHVERPLPPGAVLVVDTFGELEAVYRASRVAFVGGSLLPHGGQNVLEPAALGRPVLTGPSTENFGEEVELLRRAGGLRSGETAPLLIESGLPWLLSGEQAREAGECAARALRARRGAARATLAALRRAGLLESGRTPSDSETPSPAG